MKSRTIVVKLGTNAITKDDASLDLPLIETLVSQLSKVMEKMNVLFVTSGAMGAGRSILKNKLKYDETTSRQLFAVVGQVKLMEIYSELFAKHGIVIAQMLATKQDFENRTHALNTKNCIESLFREGILPIMNENDFVAIDELMFTDNDELAGIVAKMLFAEKLLILSNVDGVLDLNGIVIPKFDVNSKIPESIVSSERSSFGKGGMQTKFWIAQNAAKYGIEVFIANSRSDKVIERIVNGEKTGSFFNPKNYE